MIWLRECHRVSLNNGALQALSRCLIRAGSACACEGSYERMIVRKVSACERKGVTGGAGECACMRKPDSRSETRPQVDRDRCGQVVSAS